MLEKLKRFVTNKNTVTIIGLILIIGILYFVYNDRIKQATNPIRIPVAKVTIQPKTLITDSMIEYISVPAVSVKKNTVRVKNNIVGKYSNYNTMIPAGSMFYSEALITKDQLPDVALMDVAEGEVLYNFPVTMNTSYQNSIMPGSKIDIYMKAQNDDGVLMVGKLIENVNVLAVKTSDGKNVFENTSETRVPAYIFFGVNPEIHILLRKASYMSNYSVVLFPVPHGTNYSGEGETKVSIDELKEFINAHTVQLVENSELNEEINLDNNSQYDENGNLIGA